MRTSNPARVWVGTMVVAASAVLAGPPTTEPRPVVETIHGIELVDPYRWLEGDNSDPSHPGRMTDEVAAWTDAQNTYTRSVLDALPARDRIESRIRELMEVGSISAPVMRGFRYFYTKRAGSDAQPIVYFREAHDAEPWILIDPNEIDPSGLTALAWFEPNQQGTLVAFGLHRAGDEQSTLYLVDVDTGEWLADEIPGKVGGVNWLPDSTGFFYRRLEDPADPYSAQIRFHWVGTHHRQDAVLAAQRDLRSIYNGNEYSAERFEELATTWGPFAYTSRDGRWLVLGYWTGTRDNDLWVADLDRWLRTGQLVRQEVVVGAGARSWGPIVGDLLYLRTDLDAPNGRVVAVDLHHPDRPWREIIPERPDQVLEAIDVARGMLAVTWLVGATTRMELFELDGTSLGPIELPGIGSASLSTEPDRTEAFLSFSSFNMPPTIYRLDLASGQRELWERIDVPVDPELVTVEQVWYTSADGTRVSMFLVYPKGMTRNGNNPTLLYGYGGFNISLTPQFNATLFPWFEAGGMYAVANLRGGGEYGQAWHDAGRLDRKQNVFDDCIAAAEWLIENGYTRPERLAIAGGSNGGLLVGAVVTQRPELFRAAVCAVPLLDMIRFDRFLMARYWVPEYGSSADPDQFRTLLAYSPYHNVREGVRYPAMLLTAGENDARVHPMHARKMAARLQAATSASPDDRPILLWVDREAGHGAGKPLHLRVREITDQRIFLMWQLGMLESP